MLVELRNSIEIVFKFFFWYVLNSLFHITHWKQDMFLMRGDVGGCRLRPFRTPDAISCEMKEITISIVLLGMKRRLSWQRLPGDSVDMPLLLSIKLTMDDAMMWYLQ